MKMTAEDYDMLKAASYDLVRRIEAETGECFHATDDATRWAVYHKVCAESGWWIQDKLYAYLDDTHIRTALRKMFA